MAERSLDGASVVVTGASGGLGGHIARQLADAGARLTLAARDRSALEALGIDATLVSADLRHADGYAIRLRGVSTLGNDVQKK